jgi:hypothetical protein
MDVNRQLQQLDSWLTSFLAGIHRGEIDEITGLAGLADKRVTQLRRFGAVIGNRLSPHGAELAAAAALLLADNRPALRTCIRSEMLRLVLYNAGKLPRPESGRRIVFGGEWQEYLCVAGIVDEQGMLTDYGCLVCRAVYLATENHRREFADDPAFQTMVLEYMSEEIEAVLAAVEAIQIDFS